MSNLEKLRDILGKHEAGSYDLDKVCWAVVNGHGLPCPYYAEQWFDEARKEPSAYPEAHMTTDLISAINWVQQNFEGCQWSLALEDGHTSVLVTAEAEGHLLRAERCGDFGANALPLLIAQCSIEMRLTQNKVRAEADQRPNV